MRRPRRPNLDPVTAAVISGAIGATTMTTAQMLIDNPTVRYVAALVGDEVIVAKGGKADALDHAERVVGAQAARSTSRTFDTRGQAEKYAETTWGPVTRHLGLVDNPADIRAIKRRVLR